MSKPMREDTVSVPRRLLDALVNARAKQDVEEDAAKWEALGDEFMDAADAIADWAIRVP